MTMCVFMYLTQCARGHNKLCNMEEVYINYFETKYEMEYDRRQCELQYNRHTRVQIVFVALCIQLFR